MAGWHSDVLFPLPPTSPNYPNSPNSPPGLQDHQRICYKSKHNGCNQKKIICRRTIHTFAVVLTPDWEGVTDQKQHLKVCLTDLSITPGTCFVRSQDESITTCRTKHESFSRMLNGSQTYPEGISKCTSYEKNTFIVDPASPVSPVSLVVHVLNSGTIDNQLLPTCHLSKFLVRHQGKLAV